MRAPETIVAWSAFADQLAANGYCLIVPKGADRYACVARFMFTWAILEGRAGDLFAYDDRWCFSTFEAAADGLNDWLLRGFEGEPQGWHRHPDSGRRRPDGDAAAEYVER